MLIFTGAIHAQNVAINNDGSAPDSSAILDINADSMGILIPRNDTSSILQPIEGMLIFDTTLSSFYFYENDRWTALLKASSFRLFYADKDGDGFGNRFVAIYAPKKPQHYRVNKGDCDDENDSINPLATEICDGFDNDCDGLIDAEDPSVIGLTTYYADTDGDTYGNPDEDTLTCFQPAGYVIDSTDCDDTDSDINPLAQEVCDGVDNDCDGLVDDDDDSVDFGSNICESCDPACENVYGWCVTIQCEPGEGCNFSILIEPGTCWIDGSCYSNGENNPLNECQECDSVANPLGWTNVESGTACTGGTCDGAGNCIPD